MPNNDFDFSLLIKFIDGSATDAEKQHVLAWINSSESNKELYFRVKDILDHQRAADISPENLSAQWSRIQQSLPLQRTPAPFIRQWMKYAALFLLVLSIAAYFLYNNNRTPQLIHLALLPSDTARMFPLPDSSQVWLAPGSELQYYKEMEDREVWIKGAGYFSVKAQEAGTPFIVHTRRMNVTVLGTSFVVKEDDRRSSVVVSTGAVKISAAEQESVIRPNERWLLEDGRSRKEKVNAALYTAWKDNDPYLEGATLQEVTDMLRIIYEYDISIEKPELLREQAFSGRISLKDTSGLWNTLSIMYNVNITRKERQIVIQPK